MSATYIPSIFDDATAQELYSQSLKQSTDQKGEVFANFDIDNFTYEINKRDILNMLVSKFCHIGNVFTGERGQEVSFAPTGATIQSIHIARIDKDNKLVTIIGHNGKVTVVTDEYNNLMLPTLSLEEGTDTGVQYQFGRVNANETGSFLNVEARKANRSQINPTNIYLTKLNFRQLGMKNCGFNVQEIIYIDYDIGNDKVINLNVEVFYNWQTKRLEITPRGLNYINKSLLNYNVVQTSVFTQADVSVQQAMKQADNVLLDADKNRAFKEDMAKHAKELMKMYSGKADIEEIVEYEEEDADEADPISKPATKKVIKTKKVKKITTWQIANMYKAFLQEQGLKSISEELKIGIATVVKYHKKWLAAKKPENVVTIDVNP
jgi:hypothetical protein